MFALVKPHLGYLLRHKPDQEYNNGRCKEQGTHVGKTAPDYKRVKIIGESGKKH